MKQYYIYIMSSNTGTLYIGVTNEIKKRIYQHKNQRLKKWRRNKKIALIDNQNPKWEDLSEEWYE